MAAIPDKHQRGLGLVKVEKGENAQLEDPTALRMGKERLVAKKKKKSALKKLIVAEREVRQQDGTSLPSAPSAKPMQNAGQASHSLDAFSVDAPEFLPTGWVTNGSATESVAETKPTVEGAEETLPRKEEESRRKGPAVTRKAPDFVPSWVQAAEFVPSWCQQPEPGDDATAPADAAASSRAAPSTELPEAEELAVSKAIERMAAQTKDERSKGSQPKKEKKPPQTTNLEVRHYVRQVLSDELDEKVKAMLGDLARFQERARLDPLKFAKLKRFCVGMSEATRSVKRGKAKCLIVAPNLDRSEADGGLDDTVENLIDACAEFEVPVLFALSRNRMGKALGKNIRMSIVCVLSAEGVHQECKQIIKLSEELRKQWVMRRMALGAQEVMAMSETVDAKAGESGDDGAGMGADINDKVLRHLEDKRQEDERRRAEEKTKRDAERTAEKAIKQAERRAKQAELRAARDEEKAAEDRKEAEEERVKDEADAERRKIAAVKEAERQELIEKKRQEKERRAEEEQRRIAEQEAKAKAAAGLDEEDSSDDDNLPAGFNADFF